MPTWPRVGSEIARSLRFGARPPALVGVAVSIMAVAAATGAIYPLGQIARVESLAVVYFPAVLLVSTIWGLWAGLATSLLSSGLGLAIAKGFVEAGGGTISVDSLPATAAA
jgi:K+-sensing histidine kinase KdpD